MRTLVIGLVAAVAIGATISFSGSTGNAVPESLPEGTPGAVGLITPPSASQSLPADATEAVARLNASSRHGEWVIITEGADTVNSWVVYPERADKAPVVVVIHEIFGLTHWVRAVADQLAADGFIAIAPDLMTTKNLPTGPDGPERQAATAAIRTLDQAVVQRQISLVANYGMKLPAASPQYGVVGFCWGGSAVFQHAVASPSLGASVVYYGSSPATETLASVKAPILGMYGGSDNRVNATIADAATELKRLGQRFEPVIFDGAGHGFLRQQTGQDGANMRATQQAWPRTVAFFREQLRAR